MTKVLSQGLLLDLAVGVALSAAKPVCDCRAPPKLSYSEVGEVYDRLFNVDDVDLLFLLLVLLNQLIYI